MARLREKLPRGQLEGLPLRDELEALVRHYHHLQNEHKRAPLDSAPRRRIEDRLLDNRSRFDRLLDEWVPEETCGAHGRSTSAPMRPNRTGRPRSSRSSSEASLRSPARSWRSAAGTVRSSRSGSTARSWSGSSARRTSPRRRRHSPSGWTGSTTSRPSPPRPKALGALVDSLDDELRPPPWDHARELLADGVVDVHFGVTPRGRRQLARREP